MLQDKSDQIELGDYAGLSDVLACVGIRLCEPPEIPDAEPSPPTETNSPKRLDIPAMSSNL
jgi:hypothetical protein